MGGSSKVPPTPSAPSLAQLVIAGIVAFVTSFLMYRFTRPLRIDRYWHTWLGRSRVKAYLSLILAGLSGPALVAIAAIFSFTLTPYPWADGFLLAFLGYGIVKLSVTFYGPPVISQFLVVTSLGSAWIERDLSDRAEQAIATWSETAHYASVCRLAYEQYRVFQNHHKQGWESAAMQKDLTSSIADAERDDDARAKARGEKSVRDIAFRLATANNAPRPN